MNIQHGTTYVKKFIEDGNTLEETVRFLGVSRVGQSSLYLNKLRELMDTMPFFCCSSAVGRTGVFQW